MAPTAIALSTDSVNESYYGLAVGNVVVTDPNTNDVFTYSLSGADKDVFEITTDGDPQTQRRRLCRL